MLLPPHLVTVWVAQGFMTNFSCCESFMVCYRFLPACCRNLVALTTWLCAKGWYSGRSGVCRRTEPPRRSVKVKNVWEVGTGRSIQRFKAKWSEFETNPYHRQDQEKWWDKVDRRNSGTLWVLHHTGYTLNCQQYHHQSRQRLWRIHKQSNLQSTIQFGLTLFQSVCNLQSNLVLLSSKACVSPWPEASPIPTTKLKQPALHWAQVASVRAGLASDLDWPALAAL